MEPVVDLRVVRGPDWEDGDVDGGEGHVGTVVEVHCSSTSRPASAAGNGTTSESADSGVASNEGAKPTATNDSAEEVEEGGEVHSVTIQWDCGHRGRYRCGRREGKYDLRVFDTAQTGAKCRSVTCDDCRVDGVAGIRWKCSQCYDFDLCTQCYMSNKHSEDHRFVRYDTARLRSMMGYRRGVRVVESMGIFPLAEVARGHDWSWGQQDGGCEAVGKVTGITTWEDCHYRAAVEVEWPVEGRNEYRLGCKGMVDLKYTIPASGGNYFPDHLPVLGAPHRPPELSDFASSDYVRVELDAEIFQMLQERHGGWNAGMANLRGELGVVHSIQDSGDLRVTYGQRNWIINPSAVVKADIPHYVSGDVVRVMDDLAEVTKLQKDHGGWNDEMSSIVGQLGTIQGTNNNGNIIVFMKGQPWILNPFCVKMAEKGEEQEVSNPVVLGEDTTLLELRMQALMEQDDSEVLHHAALLGNLPVIRQYLEKYPNEVDAKFTGKTALHCAVAAGKMNVVEALLELQANLECSDDEGFKPLHHCAVREQPELATALLKAGADPNSKCHNEQTPLTLAAIKGSTKVLAALLDCPTTRLAEPDKDGDTALHCAIHGRNYQSVRILLESGADPSLVNFNILTPLHLAVKVGFLSAVESIVDTFPEHVNVREQMGCTPLHLAAGEGEFEVAKTLLKNEQCAVNAMAEMGLTPLHGAVMKDQSRMVELLLGHGADPTITDNDGDTPLHMALNNEDLHHPSDRTLELNKVKDLLMEMTDEVSGQLVVACFLIREGADTTDKNRQGQTPLDVCSPEMAVLLSAFAERYAKTGEYRGSLLATKQAPSRSQENQSDSQTRQVNEEEPSNQSESCDVSKSPGESTRKQTLQQTANHPLATPTPQQTANHPLATPLPTVQDGVKVPSTIASQTSPILTTRGTPALCFLCDFPITVKFEPCGHSTVCKHCASRAKKCPECKTPVRTVTELQT